MRNITLAIAASLTMTLAACGDAEEGAATPDTTTAAEDTQSAEAAAPETEDAETTTTEETNGEATEATADESEDADEETQDTMESEKSPRGNIIKQIGEKATVATEGGEGDVLVEFVVTDIETNAECTNEYADEAANGNYIVLTFEVETMSELANQEFVTSWNFNPYDFQVFDADGKRENDSTGNAYSCLSDAESLPFDIGAGQTVEGKVALDSAFEEGFIAYVPMAMGAGWEWEFGGSE